MRVRARVCVRVRACGCVCVRAREWLCPAWLSSTQEGGADGTHLLVRAFAADHSVGKEAEVRCRAVAQLVAHDARQRLHGTSSTPQSHARVLRVNPPVPGWVGSLSTHTAHGTAHHRLTESCRVAAPGGYECAFPDRMGPLHCTRVRCKCPPRARHPWRRCVIARRSEQSRGVHGRTVQKYGYHMGCNHRRWGCRAHPAAAREAEPPVRLLEVHARATVRQRRAFCERRLHPFATAPTSSVMSAAAADMRFAPTVLPSPRARQRAARRRREGASRSTAA